MLLHDIVLPTNRYVAVQEDTLFVVALPSAYRNFVRRTPNGCSPETDRVICRRSPGKY
jgi:hypothetical protein